MRGYGGHMGQTPLTGHPIAGARSGQGGGSRRANAAGGLAPAAVVVEAGPGGVRGQAHRAAALEVTWEVLQAALLRLLAEAYPPFNAAALRAARRHRHVASLDGHQLLLHASSQEKP